MVSPPFSSFMAAPGAYFSKSPLPQIRPCHVTCWYSHGRYSACSSCMISTCPPPVSWCPPSCSHPSLAAGLCCLEPKDFPELCCETFLPTSQVGPFFSHMNPEPLFLLLMTFSSTHSTPFHLSVFWWHCSLLQGSAID